MAKSKGGAVLSFLAVDRHATMPIYRQLEEALRRAILSRKLRSGVRLPATRQLADDLGVSRLTIKNVYEQLIAEGYLSAVRGAGTYVAEISPLDLSPDTAKQTPPSSPPDRVASDRSIGIARTKAITRLQGTLPFRPGVPALDLFPRRIWAAITSRAIRTCGSCDLGYGPPGGLPVLKEAIADMVRDMRGVRCEPEQVVVTAGAQQAFTLIAFTLLNPGDIVWCEDPGHVAGRDAMRILGSDLRSVPIDDQGFDLDHAIAHNPDAKLLFTTPSHQHPLGVTMSLKRRLDLLDYARRMNAWIIEDDYDSEYRYRGRPQPALQGLDDHGHVIYVGTFSKTLFPAVRLGYLIAPPDHVDAFAAGQSLLSQNVSALTQTVVARFLEQGAYLAHIRKMRGVYKERRDCLIENLERSARGLLDCRPTDAGMHLVAWLSGCDDRSAAEAIWRAGIDCLPLSMYCDQRRVDDGLMLGFACAPEKDIPENVETLVRALESVLEKPSRGIQVERA